MVHFSRSLCLAVDVQGYSGRDAPGQADAQAGLVALLDAAADAAGLDRTAWLRQQAGDGELSIVPPGQSEIAVVQRFPLELARLVFARNVHSPADRRLRLRLAVEHGPVEPGANGFVGATAVAVSRLVDAPAARAVLARADAALVQVLSDRVFLDVVRGGYAADPAEFQPITVRVKEFEGRAWVRVPGMAPPAAEPPPSDPAAAPPGQTVHTRIDGAVQMSGGVIGINNSW
ncbi:hypothetical protein [Actinokineospora sp. NPDC004072]